MLVVEDDEDVRDALEGVLSRKGFAVTLVANGEDALAVLRSAAVPPAVIVLDINMPVMDGPEFLRARARLPSAARIPVVIMSGVTSVDDELAAACTVVQKPVSTGNFNDHRRPSIRVAPSREEAFSLVTALSRLRTDREVVSRLQACDACGD